MNIKKLVASVMAFCVVAGALPANTVKFVDNSIVASAEDEFVIGKSGNLSYLKYSDHVVISGCDESAESVDIPAEIDGLPVTEIGDSAFAACYNLTSINIPNSVTSIGVSAFFDCLNLTSLNIPDSVKSISDFAFGYCTNLTSINLSNNITSISPRMFRFCSSLKNITIPNSVTNISDYVFEGCSNLKEIVIPNSVTSIGLSPFASTQWLENKQKENPLVIVNNILIDGETCVGNIAIPNIVTNINDFAFSSCESLTEITIPNSTISIGDGAFSFCENLEKITILNPDCEIYDDSYTIQNGTIYGYEGSTAQAYAEKYGREFVSLGEAPTGDEEKTDVLLGDANEDGEVNMADVTAIIQHIGNKDAYALTEQGAVNADCDSQEGITGNDALAVQLLVAKQIDKLPYVE